MKGWSQDGDATARRLKAMNKIRKLLRLAEDQEGQPEGEAALRRADALMAQHGIERSSLHLDEGNDYRHRAFRVGRKEAWRRTLVDLIAEWFDCAALYKGESEEVETYGPEHALPQIEYTYAVYLRQLRDAWRDHTTAMRESDIWRRLTKRQQLDAREAFCVSFVLGVKERMAAERVRERTEDPLSSQSSDAQRKELERWMRRGGVRWRAKPSGVFDMSTEGYRAGMEARAEPGVEARRIRRRLGAPQQ